MDITIDALKLSHVPRWSIVDLSRKQSVSDHSYRATIIFIFLIKELNIKVEHLGESLLTSLFHDVAEARTGDIPSSYKRVEDRPEHMCGVVREVFKVADCVEAFIWASRYAVGDIKGVLKDVKKNMVKHAQRVVDILANQDEVSCDIKHLGEVIEDLIQKGRSYA
jgi:hypothetical protein